MRVGRLLGTSILLIGMVSCTPVRSGQAGTGEGNWRALADGGQYLEALRALDANRQQVVDQFKADLIAALPEAVLGLEAEELYDNTSTIQIALLQTYTSEEVSVRVDVTVHTVEISQRTAIGAQLQQVIRDALAEEREPAVRGAQHLLVHDFAAMLRQDGSFFERPQMLVHLNHGAQVVLHSLTDVEIDEFRAIAESLPLHEIDGIIGGNRQ